MEFSVLMSVYIKETVEHFVQSIESVLGQTVLPNEIILVQDGPVETEMEKCISEYVNKYPFFVVVKLEKNVGLGNALKIGLEKATNNIIARMDTDDICLPTRFEKQIAYLYTHPEIDVLGTQIQEFVETMDCLGGIRKTPIEHEEIRKFMKKRNPFNHMTVMFRKDKVLAAGNYQELKYVEDYYLWCRMQNMNCKFANLEDVLVYARIGKDMYKRRGGYNYFKSWVELEKYKYDSKLTNRCNYYSTLCMRFLVQVVLPNNLRGIVLNKFSRKVRV